MAKKILDLGTGPNTGTGDNYREAFEKVKDNLDEIYESDNRTGQSISFNRPSGSIHNTPQAPFVDTIPINIIMVGDLNEENNDSKDGNEVGVWFVTSNSSPAYSGNFTGQILKAKNALDVDELCLVWLTYFKLSGIITEQVQAFDPPYIPNSIPVISLIGNSTIDVIIGNAYNDQGAVANDTEDGDITANIIVGGDIVDVNTLGTYLITFDVQDSNGANAAQVIRTVNVITAIDSSGVLTHSGVLNQL